ncbi:hypothetical protein ACFWPV_31170 [Streptomyces uncialis]|uniref:hypothetical protein n=1 Tax=Streptomyces uncialis TaxID=1048205 RepID=UPI00364DFA60
MTPPPPRPEAPALVLRGPFGTVWLDPGAIMLKRDGDLLRIPVHAVEGIRTVGRRATLVELSLTAPPGTPATVHRLRCRDRRAVARFAEAAEAALPVRDRTEPREDGAVLTEYVERREPGPLARVPRRLLVAVTAALVVHGGGLATMIVAGETHQAIMWGVGVVPLVLGAMWVRVVAQGMYRRSVLRRHGVTVVATVRKRHSGYSSVFRFTDLSGATREIEADALPRRLTTKPERVEVAYDPRGRVEPRGVLPRTLRAFIAAGGLVGAAMVVGGLYLLPYQLVVVLTGWDPLG